MIIPIKNAARIGLPFCDYLNITSPKENQPAIHALILPFVDALGCLSPSEWLYSIPQGLGTFKMGLRGGVCVFSFSGGFLARLRELNLFNELLAVFAEFEYRISLMHVTCDFAVDSPKVLKAIYKVANKGLLNLTNKPIKPEHCFRIEAKNEFGVDTGSVYFGSKKNADIWGKAYDKRHERQVKGFEVDGQVLRLEFGVMSDVGATLRDVSVPYDLFFHIASRSLVEKPSDFRQWTPYGFGFELDKKEGVSDLQKLKGLVEYGSELSRAIKLARRIYGDDEGLTHLIKLVTKRYKSSLWLVQ